MNLMFNRYFINQSKFLEIMESLNESKKKQPHEDKKISSGDKTDSNAPLNNTPAKHNIDDMELNEEQLDIISGGTDINFVRRG